LKAFFSSGNELKSRGAIFHATISCLVRAEFPVIAAVNGAAAGAGMGLACACDLVIAAESARFIMAYSKIGLSPTGTTTYFLPRRIGIGRAMELVLLIPSLRHSSATLSSPRNRAITIRTFSSAEYWRRVARRISRTVFSAASECRSAFDLIAAPSRLR